MINIQDQRLRIKLQSEVKEHHLSHKRGKTDYEMCGN